MVRLFFYGRVDEEFVRDFRPIFYYHSAAVHFDFPLGEEPYRLRVYPVLLLQYPCGKRVLGVIGKYRHDRLDNYWAGVHPRIDKMHGASGKFCAVLYGLPLDVQAGERRQERGVYVHYFILVRLNQRRRNEA